MKITKVNTTVVQNEPPYVGGKYFLFLHLETDEGIVGIGEKVTGSSFNNSNWSDFKSQINLINETVINHIKSGGMIIFASHYVPDIPNLENLHLENYAQH